MGYDFGVGREAPTFTLSAVDGSEIRLNQYRGDWFPVLAFIPTQTPGAVEALEHLSKAADTLWGLRGQLVGLCDAGRDECVTLAGQVPGLAFPLLPDDGAVAQAVRRAPQGRHRPPHGLHHRPRRQDRLDRRGRGGAQGPEAARRLPRRRPLTGRS